VTAALNADGVARIMEGVRLARQLPGARLVVSGGLVRKGEATAHGYASAARALGIEPGSIVVLDQARDTASEARDVAPVVNSEPFYLVTTVDHMRRAMRLMERAGLHPIPAPASRGPVSIEWSGLVPSSHGLRATELALHEYMGLAAIALGFD